MPHAPIVRYRVDDDFIEELRSKKLKLLIYKDGHAEVLGGKTKGEALGWLSRKQARKVEVKLKET